MKKILFLVVVLFPFFVALTFGQHSDSVEVYTNPRVIGMPRPTGISIEYERVMDYRIYSKSNVSYLQDGDGEINYNRRIKAKFKIPVVNKDRFKLTYGFSYAHEEFRFDDIEEINYSLYKSLEDKSLKSLGSSFYFLFPQKNKTFFALRVNINLNGDYYLKDANLLDFVKVSAGPMWGKKPNESLMYGVGFAYSYTFGDPSISPIIAFYKTFNKKWGIEAMIPLEAKVRYTANQGTIFYAGAEARGASYNIRLDDPSLADKNTLELRHSEVKFFLSLNKEIHDFLWLSFDAGYRYNLNFNLAESNRNRKPTNFFERDYIVESKLQDAFYFNVSLNIKPPKKWYNN